MELMTYKVFHGAFIRWVVFCVQQLVGICKIRDREEWRF
jgi:hypothetical protein